MIQNQVIVATNTEVLLLMKKPPLAMKGITVLRSKQSI